MSEATSLAPETRTATLHAPTPTVPRVVDEVHLREVLKRCSPDTCEAAWAFRKTGDLVHIPVIVHGVIERYMDHETRAKLSGVTAQLRLSEDLGIDSLTMMEIALLAEDVFPIAIHNEELCGLRTVADISRFITSKLEAMGSGLVPAPVAS